MARYQRSVNERETDEHAAIKRMESSIGFFHGIDGNGQEITLDPHHTEYKPLANLFKRGGQMIDARDDEEERLLRANGFVPVVG